MPPAVLPPVLSAESRVAMRTDPRLVYPLPALQKQTQPPVNQSKTSRTGLQQREPPACMAQAACTLNTMRRRVVLEVRPSQASVSPRLRSSTRDSDEVPPLGCFGSVKNEAISRTGRGPAPGSRGSWAREGPHVLHRPQQDNPS